MILLIFILLQFAGIQRFLANKVKENVLAGTPASEVEFERLKIGLSGKISLYKVLIPGDKESALFEVGKLRIKLKIAALFRSEIYVRDIFLKDTEGKLIRYADRSSNYDPFLNSFVAAENPTEKSTSNLKITVGNIALNNISFSLHDSLTGFYLDAKLEDFKTDMRGSKIPKLHFTCSEVLLKGADVTISTEKKEYEKKETAKKSDPVMPVINVSSLNLSDVRFEMKDYTSKMDMLAKVKRIQSKPAKVDITEELVYVESINLKNADYFLYSPPNNKETVSTTIEKTTSSKGITFSGGWEIIAEEVTSKNTSCKLKFSLTDSITSFDPLNQEYNEVDFHISNAHVTHDSIRARIHRLSLTGKNDFTIKNLEGDYLLTHHSASFDQFLMESGNSRLNGYGTINIPLNNPENFERDLRLEAVKLNGRLNIGEVSYFISDIAQNFGGVEKKSLGIDLNIESNDTISLLSRAKFQIGNVFYGDFSNSKVHRVNNTSTFSLVFDSLFVRHELLPLPLVKEEISRPKFYFLKGEFSGDFDSLNLRTNLTTDLGSLKLNAIYLTDSLASSTIAELRFANLDVGKILNDTSFEKMSGKTKLELLSRGLDSLIEVDISSQVKSITYQNTLFENILVNAKKMKDSIHVRLESGNPDFDLLAAVSGKTMNKCGYFDYNFEINDVSSLLLWPDEPEYTLHSEVVGTLEYCDTSRLGIKTIINGSNFHHEGNDYPLPTISADYIKDKDNVNIGIRTEGVKFDATSNMGEEQIKTELRTVLISLFRNIPQSFNDTLKTLSIDAEIYNPYPLLALLSSGLIDSLEVDTIKLTYNNYPRNIAFNGKVPKAKYSGIGAENLQMNVTMSGDDFHSSIVVDKFYKNDLSTGLTKFTSSKQNRKLNSRLTINDKSAPIFSIPISSEIVDSNLIISLVPDSLIIGYEEWEIPEKIQFINSFKTGRWSFDDVFIKNGERHIAFKSEQDKLQLQIKNGALGNMKGILNYSDTAIITGGLISGVLTAEFEDDKYEYQIEGDISDISVYGENYGDIHFGLSSKKEKGFDVKVDMRNNSDFIKYTGTLGSVHEKGQNLEFNINDFSSYKRIITNELIEIQQGGISGNLDADLDQNSPAFKGQINFSDALVYVVPIGSVLKFKDENIRINETGIHFEKTEINDKQDNTLFVDGGILTTDYKTFTYDLKFNTDYFMVFNTTEQENETLFGKLVLSADIDLKGVGLSPQLKASAEIHNETDFTLVMPGEEMAISTGEGVVSFQEKVTVSDSAFLADNLTLLVDSVSRVLGDSKMQLNLLLNEGARYTIVTNPESGDFAYFGLKGFVNYSYDKARSNALTGNIRIIDGSYTISFYEMIKKEFDIQENSNINFSGPLNNATIDLSAKDVIRTNSMALMATESPYMSNEEKALYSQRLPYEIIFKMRGFVMNPEISFGIDLPQTYKVNSPMIASKLNKLEGDDYEQERNMQVFALLVTGGFFAENTGAAGSSGTSNYAVAAARNSVNGILAQQLNNMTSRYINYVDVNLGFNTYEDITRGSGHLTTDLDVQVSKTLLDNRLKLEVDSRINLDNSPSSVQNGRSAYNTDFTILYDITKGGNYKVKAFNLQIYDLFDGDISNAGFGLMFTKDFDSKARRKNYVEVDSIMVHD